MAYDPADKFNQDAEGIHFTHRAPEPRVLLTQSQYEAARKRIAAGEDVEEVAMDLVTDQIEDVPTEEL